MSDRATNALTVVVLGFVGLRLANGVRHSRSATGRSLVVEIVRGIGWRHIWPVPCVLAAVATTAGALLQVPILRWGWWSALGGRGNPVFGSSSTTTGSALEWVIPLVFVALLVPALPLFAHAEEQMFRRGAQHWSPPRRAGKVVQFGLVHALIGIPIGAALALSIGGAYFMSTYLRSWRVDHDERVATLESARAHTAYNGIIVVAVLAIVLAGVVGSDPW